MAHKRIKITIEILKKSGIIYNTTERNDADRKNYCGSKKTVDKMKNRVYTIKTVADDDSNPQRNLEKKKKKRVDKSRGCGIINELSRKGWLRAEKSLKKE